MVMELDVLGNPEGQWNGPRFPVQKSGCSTSGRCGNGMEKIYPTCAVRYGLMGYIGEFRYSPGQVFNCGGQVVIQTNRGMELGEQVSLTCTGCDKSVDRKQMLNYVKASGPEFMTLKAGKILRAATPQDVDEAMHLNQDAARKLIYAREKAAEMQLDMKFVCCEHLLGGERIIFHFMSEERVDFRELVKLLAAEYHTRIEMHQVGARDEARLVADYEICGRECCCRNFLKKLRQVNMKMAKLQKATLDPSKVSGRCGRLRCCLRYEHEGYEELNKKLPRSGSRVRTERGVGTVRDRQVLTQLLVIEYDDNNERETLGIEAILERALPKPKRPDKPEGDAPDQRDEKRPRNRRRRDDDRRDGGGKKDDARPPRKRRPRTGDAERPNKNEAKSEAPSQPVAPPSDDVAPNATPPKDTDSGKAADVPQDAKSVENREEKPRKRRRRGGRGRKGKGKGDKKGGNKGGDGDSSGGGSFSDGI